MPHPQPLGSSVTGNVSDVRSLRNVTTTARHESPARTSIELFTGGGGLAISMHEAGFRHVLLNEFDRRACDTLRLNRAVDADTNAAGSAEGGRWPLIEGDVQKIQFAPWDNDLDVLAGGVPCQPWSLGGAHRGSEDRRNLWPEFARAMRETHPKAIIAENVKGLLRPSFSAYWSYTLRCLELPNEVRLDGEHWMDHDRRLVKTLRSGNVPDEERYIIDFLPVNAADYGVPQIRNRVFVVGFRADLAVDWRWPKPTHSDEALREAQADGTYWEQHGIAPRPVDAPKRIARPGGGFSPGTARWRTLRDAIRGLPEPSGHKVEHPNWLHHFGWDGARSYPGHTPNVLDRPAKTVKAGVHGVPGGETVLRRDDGSIRYMTVREVSRVMTFPDDWRLAGPRGEQIRQLGNAVPVELGRVFTQAVAGALPPSP